jgi:hypothetical protein
MPCNCLKRRRSRGCSGVSTECLCAPRTVARRCLRTPTPRVAGRSNGRPSWALEGPHRPFPCVLLPSCFRTAWAPAVNVRFRTSGPATRSHRMLAMALPRAPAWAGCVRCAARQWGCLGRSRDGLARVRMRAPSRPHTAGRRLASRGAPGDPEAAPGGSGTVGRCSRAMLGVGGAPVANVWAHTPRLHISLVYCLACKKLGDLSRLYRQCTQRPCSERLAVI